MIDMPQGIAHRPLVERPRVQADELETLIALAGGADNCVGVFPLSPLQQGFMFHHLLDPTSYVVSMVWDVSGPIDVGAFEQAWNDLVAQHETLRTIFSGNDLAAPLQLVQRSAPISITWHDWEGASGADLGRRLSDLVEADRRAGFDLGVAPVMRVQVARSAADAHHVLWSFHHILLDGWSMPILLRDLMTHYRARATGTVALAEKAPPFRDYVAWLQTRDAHDSEAYWRQAFAGFFEGAPRPARADTRASGRTQAERTVTLATTPDRVEALARTLRITPGAVVHAAVGLYLANRVEGGRAVFGTTVSARPPELTDVAERVGLYANLLPVLADPRRSPTVGAWLRVTQDQLTALIAHQHCPLPAVRQWSGLPTDDPLFTATVSIETVAAAPPEPMPADRIGFGPVRIVERPHYPLNLLFRMQSAIALTIVYDPALYAAADIEQICDDIDGHLAAFAETGPDAALALANASATMPPAAWNETTMALAPHFIHDLIDQAAAQFPDHVAVQANGEAMTYATLQARSNRLARHLATLGVGADVIVPVLLDRSMDLIVAMVAVLKAGGVYVPLATDDPPERLHAILRDIGARVAIGREGVEAVVAQHGLALIDPNDPNLAAYPDACAPVALAPLNLAYVLFTSGTTGGPKGVMVTHEGIANLIAAEAETTAIAADDRVLQFKPVNFDASMFEMFATLAAGGTLVLASLTVRGAERDLADVLVEHAISVLVCSPQMLATLAGRMPPTLRLAILGGDVLTPDIAGAASAIRLVNQYGPTETTVCATEIEIDDPARVSIGRPLPNMRVHIVDAQRRLAAVGQPGELHIAGIGLARCYLNNPALTADRFVPDPWGPPGSRAYRTGDFARWWPNGQIDFLHRETDQVKIRGFRVAPGEIEDALARDPAVERAVVAVKEDARGEKYLVAYLLPATADFDETAVRDRLASRLPRYMIPRALVPVAMFALTPNGKIDRTALPEPPLTTVAHAVALQSAPQQIIAQIWTAILGVGDVGLDDNFFDLGGHSLLAMRMIARVRRQLNIDLPLTTVFANPTLGGLARAANDAMMGMTGAALLPIRPRASADAPPMSYAQERLWFLDKLGFGAAYNLPVTLEIEGPLERSALAAALSEIVRRHESLRTRFAMAEGSGVQIVEPPAPLKVKFVDLRGGDPAEIAEDLRELRLAESRRPFDLTVAPLIRANVWTVDDDRHVVLLMLHHIVSDGWSAEQLVQELLTLLGDAAAGRESALPALAIQYGDYARWERESAPGSSDAHLAYWKDVLDGAPAAIDLPTDFPRPVSSSFGGALEPLAVPADLLARLRALAQREDVTLFMVVMAGFNVLLHRWSGQSDIVVGTTIAGRNRVELEPLIGLLANTLPIRVGLGDDPSFRTVLRRVKDATLGAYVHQDVRLEKIIEALNVNRDLTRQPLFQVSIASQTVDDDSFDAGGLRVRRKFDVELVRAKFDLSLHVFETPATLAMAIEYSTDLFGRDTIAEMAAQLLDLLDRLAAAPGASIRSADATPRTAPPLTLPSADRSDAPGGLLERFAVIAGNAPDARAVDSPAGPSTYAELDADSDRLAAELVGLGVAADVLVALHVATSRHLAIGVLGILKAGGVPLPIEAMLTAEQIGHRLEVSNAPILVTSSDLEPMLPIHFCQLCLIDTDDTAPAVDHREPPARDGGALAWAEFTRDRHLPPRLVGLSYDALSAAVRDTGPAVSEQGSVAMVLLAALLDRTGMTFVWPQAGGGSATIELPEAADLIDRGGSDGGLADGAVRALVLDRSGVPTAAGVPGELYLGGRSLAQGYLGDPEASAQAFVRAAGDGERLWRTGFRARFRPDGSLDIRGRLDRRIAMRGLPVDLDVIERALRTHPSIADALVLPRPGDADDEILTGYVVARAGAEIASALALKDYLANRVTLEETPTVFIPIGALPLLADGTIDRDSLPAPDGSSQTEPPFEAPASPTEIIVAEVWNDLLGRPSSSIHSNFFQVGGESMKATLLLTRVNQRLDIEVRLSKFFENPTIKGVADHIDASRSDTARAPVREAVIGDFM